MSYFNKNSKMDFYEYENDDFTFITNGKKTKKGFLFILSVVFFVIGFLISCLNTFIYLRQSYEITSFNTKSYYILGTIIISIIIIIAFSLLSNHVFKKKRALLIFSIIYLLGSFLLITITVQAAIKEVKIAENAKDKLISICNDIDAGKDISNINYDKSEYGKLAPILDLVTDYGIKSSKLSTNITENLSSSGIESLFSSDTFSSTEKLNNGKKKLNDCAQIYSKSEDEFSDLMSDLENSVLTLELPSALKSEFLDDFRKSQTKTIKNISDLFKVENDIFSKTNDVLNFMSSIHGNYVIQNNQILFKRDADLNKFNSYTQDIRKLLEKGSEINESMITSQRLDLDQLNNSK